MVAVPKIGEGKRWLSTLFGYIAVTLAMLSLCVSVTCVQALRRSIPDFELNVCRFTIQFTISFVITKIQGTTLKVERNTHGWLCLLILTNVIYNAAYFGGAAMIPLSATAATVNVSLMIGVALLSKLFLRVNVATIQLIAVCICIIGIFCVSQPEPIFGSNMAGLTTEGPWNTSSSTINTAWNITPPARKDNNHEVLQFQTLLGYSLVCLAGLAEAVFSIIAGVVLVDLDTICQAVWVSLLGIPISLIISVFLEAPVLPTEPFHIALLLGHCFTASFTTIGTTYACKTVGPMRTSLVHSFGLIVLLIPQYTFMNHIMPSNRNWLEVAGIIIVTIGVGLTPVFDLIVRNRNSDISS